MPVKSDIPNWKDQEMTKKTIKLATGSAATNLERYSSMLTEDYITEVYCFSVCPVSPMVKENIGDRVLKRLEQEKVMPSGV